jgi:hypothetical protein
MRIGIIAFWLLQWITIWEGNGRFMVKNRYQFTDLDRFRGKWTLLENGVAADSGTLKELTVRPGDSAVLGMPHWTLSKPGMEYIVRISFETTKDALWAPAVMKWRPSKLSSVRRLMLRRAAASHPP